MKKCTDCGKEYPDETQVCAIDQEPLQSDAPTPASESEITIQTPTEISVPINGESDLPEGFSRLGIFDPFEANRMLQRFEADSIRFLIDKVEKQVVTARGIWKTNLIEICVHQDELERANRIMTADWQV